MLVMEHKPLVPSQTDKTHLKCQRLLMGLTFKCIAIIHTEAVANLLESL